MQPIQAPLPSYSMHLQKESLPDPPWGISPASRLSEDAWNAPVSWTTECGDSQSSDTGSPMESSSDSQLAEAQRGVCHLPPPPGLGCLSPVGPVGADETFAFAQQGSGNGRQPYPSQTGLLDMATASLSENLHGAADKTLQNAADFSCRTDTNQGEVNAADLAMQKRINKEKLDFSLVFIHGCCPLQFPFEMLSCL